MPVTWSNVVGPGVGLYVTAVESIRYRLWYTNDQDASEMLI
jgi:hypothetical protein